MKSTIKLTIFLTFVFMLIFIIQLYRGYKKLEDYSNAQSNLITRLQKKKQSNQIHFVWNDDEESIPADGSIIKVEYTDENTVYIGPFYRER